MHYFQICHYPMCSRKHFKCNLCLYEFIARLILLDVYKRQVRVMVNKYVADVNLSLIFICAMSPFVVNSNESVETYSAGNFVFLIGLAVLCLDMVFHVALP